MDNLPDPRVSVDPISRHGTARLFLGINASVYALRPAQGPTPAWTLKAVSGPRPGARYTALVTRHGLPACTCPDHQLRGARCKHLGALISAGLLAPEVQP